MVMVKNPFCFMNCFEILVFWLKFKQLQNRDLPPHVVALPSVSYLFYVLPLSANLFGYVS
jgi:hypothetical protein